MENESQLKRIVGMKVEEIDCDEYDQFIIDFIKGKQKIRLYFPDGSEKIEVVIDP